MKVKELLTEANWIQGASFQDKDGKPLLTAKAAVKFCLIGAIEKCYPLTDEADNVIKRIQLALQIPGDPTSVVVDWNDSATWPMVRDLVSNMGV